MISLFEKPDKKGKKKEKRMEMNIGVELN